MIRPPLFGEMKNILELGIGFPTRFMKEEMSHLGASSARVNRDVSSCFNLLYGYSNGVFFQGCARYNGRCGSTVWKVHRPVPWKTASGPRRTTPPSFSRHSPGSKSNPTWNRAAKKESYKHLQAIQESSILMCLNTFNVPWKLKPSNIFNKPQTDANILEKNGTSLHGSTDTQAAHFLAYLACDLLPLHPGTHACAWCKRNSHQLQSLHHS